MRSVHMLVRKRPKMKVGGFFSSKVDTIRHCQEQIPILDKEVKKLQKIQTFNATKLNLC